MSRRRWEFEEGEELCPGRFAIRRLGGGSDYEVYLVWDDHFHATVAAKLVRPHLVDDLLYARRLERESALLERLAHPSLPRLFGSSLEGQHPHVLLEHLEGPPLGRVIERFGPIDLVQMLPLAITVAGFLHYLAAEDHVHLDLKPNNIVLTAVPKVIDLSLARTTERAARLEEPVGTPNYMSPEQCRAGGGATVGSPADVWGLGMTLYEAASGVKPFPSTRGDSSAASPQVTSEPRPLGPDVPRDLASLIHRCLAKEPGERPLPATIVSELEPMIEALPRQRVRRGR